MILKIVNKFIAADFISTRHYSAVMPRLTKHFLGCFDNDELVGVITFGWGTRPKHTIQKLFPNLDTKDYFEIGKMCMDDKMPRNSESQLLKLSVKWLKENTSINYLFTWADGLVGKPGYVYQAANFLYGGFSFTDTYISKTGEKIHPRTIQGQIPNTKNRKVGMRPNPQQLKELELSRVKGKQFRYIYPMTKKDRKNLKKSTEIWSINYPKHSDLKWKIKRPGEEKYTETNKMPFTLSKEMVYNRKNVESFKRGNLSEFL
jgi:hypothetical protein|tara:strand:- start:295 stop:1074 length:780 start_codon:yes stop_codon:yes gene_type:complete